jgi:hypothetical protein
MTSQAIDRPHGVARESGDDEYLRSVESLFKSKTEWQKLVWNRVSRIRADLNAALPDGAQDPARETINELLMRAEGAADKQAKTRNLVANFRQWWYGSMSDFAWLSLHEAEALVARLESNGQSLVRARCLVEKASVLLLDKDSAVIAVKAELEGIEKAGRTEGANARKARLTEGANAPKAPCNESTHTPNGSAANSISHPREGESFAILVSNLSRVVQDASDERYAQSRSFRNRIIRLCITAFVFLVLTMIPIAMGVVDLWPHDGPPSEIQVTIGVALFGTIGAFVTSVPSLARVQGTWNPYSLPLYQMFLKLLLGPIFAFVGILFLSSDLVPNIKSPVDFPKLLVWAVIFGAGQQAVTRFVDDRVAGLVSQDPSADPGAAAAASGRRSSS